GNRPYSIKLADGTQIEYRRGDPFFSTLGILADFWTASGEIEEADKYGLAAAMISSIAANLLNKSYLSNVDTLIRAFAADDPEYAQQLLNSSAGSFVPSAAKD